jgi:hypothetical protein
VNCAFLRINLLKAQIVRLFVKVSQRRPRPLLVSLGIIPLQSVDVLGELLEDFLLKVTLGLARCRIAAVGSTGRRLEMNGSRAIKLSFLGRLWRWHDICSSIRRLGQHAFRRRSGDDARHDR